MADTKWDYTDKVAIGYDVDNVTIIEAIVSYNDRQVSPQGMQVSPLVIINQANPTGVGHHHKSWEMFLEMDTWNYEAFMTQQVQTGEAASRAMRQTAKNDPIGYFNVNESDTAGTVKSKIYDTLKVYLARLSGKFTNRKVERNGTVIAKFICIEDRVPGTTVIAGSATTDRKIIGIASVTVNSQSSTNILDFEFDFRGPQARDIVEPQFKPNLNKASNVQEWDGKYLWMKIVHDSVTDIYDSYNDDTGNNAVIPSMSIIFELDDGSTEVWTMEASKTFVANKGPENSQGEFETQEHREGEYEFITYGEVTITHP